MNYQTSGLLLTGIGLKVNSDTLFVLMSRRLNKTNWVPWFFHYIIKIVEAMEEIWVSWKSKYVHFNFLSFGMVKDQDSWNPERESISWSFFWHDHVVEILDWGMFLQIGVWLEFVLWGEAVHVNEFYAGWYRHSRSARLIVPAFLSLLLPIVFQ